MKESIGLAFHHLCLSFLILASMLLSSILMQFLTSELKRKWKRKWHKSENSQLFFWLFLSSLLWQINRAPSFGTDQKIDYDVKKGVLLNALKLLNIRYSSAATHALTPIIAPRSSALSSFQNLVLPSSINSPSTRLHVRLALVAQRPRYAASSSPFLWYCCWFTSKKFRGFIMGESEKWKQQKLLFRG